MPTSSKTRASSRSTGWAKSGSSRFIGASYPVENSLHSGSDGEALVQPVDQVGHLLEPVGDHAQPVLAEVLRLDAERRRKAGDDLLRGHRPVGRSWRRDPGT